MPIQVLMPALSPTMTEGKIVKWHKAEGDSVESGDVLAEIETDKATMEVEAVDEGTLGKIVIAEGTEGVAVNSLIALILEEGEDASALEGAAASAPAPAPSAAPAPQPVPAPTAAPASAPQTQQGARVFASPLARRIAADGGIDISILAGTGPHGRIVKRDVEAALSGGAPVAATTRATRTVGFLRLVSLRLVVAETPCVDYEKVSLCRVEKAVVLI